MLCCEPSVLPRSIIRFLFALIGTAALAATLLLPGEADAADPPSTAGPLMGLLRSGRVPPERLGTIVELVCRRGNEHDLGFVFSKCVEEGGWTGELRQNALQHLAEAASTRKVKPAGDLSRLSTLVHPEKPGQETSQQLLAVDLAGLWQVAGMTDTLKSLALSDKTPRKLRTASLSALVEIGNDAAQQAIEQLTASDRSQEVRYQAAAGLVSLDMDKAAETAVTILSEGSADDDPAPMVDAFLDHQGGPERLARAIAGKSIPEDVAKLALRHMYGVGRSDAALSDALSKAAGISTEVPKLTKAQVKELEAEVLAHGDPAIGEAIFRRADLSCMRCHAVSKAGGQIGPDLSAVGASSPVEYLIHSILDPDQAIKEAFKTSIIITIEGKILTGIVVDRDDDRVVIKDAAGKERTIPTADIDDEAEGSSLMPKGLTKFLTHDELVHLVRFLSELGKPGEYVIRAVPTIQRWRVLKEVPQALREAPVDEEVLADHVLNADEAAWLPVYGKVAGTLPLGDLPKIGDQPVMVIRGEIDVTSPGAISLNLDSAEGVQVWLDHHALQPGQSQIVTEVPAGRHQVILRIDRTQRKSDGIRVEVSRPQGSSAQVTVVGGQ